MITFRIISTIIVGIICFIAFCGNCALFGGSRNELRDIAFWTFVDWIFLAFVIVSLWVI